ncbi:HRDC domain-containing protein [Mucilaginibacter sp. L3T2-6]|uniref:HRDC domain-containing protein n=1 Tax=Mucilaginibacter sp. L3T2-6 TaxID=3062491 RepID=UPI0026750CC8|nr:HRDC domain-containing protein [Mucilaginibacter sp. L3T2-6]MDO3643084.1 AAA family ATPase [Mucilaginibacter sp. L3T2-6]MDV6215851.1 AAA family ATPase [Mucilaginibacter sp. L3T2-6]
MAGDNLQELITSFLTETNRPVFLTGKAGTGKTTFLRSVKSTINKNLAIVAPTAVAAINAGGVTIHSFFQVPFGPLVPGNDSELKPVSFEKSKLLKCLDLLIIDEISMVRADTLDYIDSLLRQIKGSVRPFGGVQLLMIGDLFQLPPVYEKDWHVLRNFYEGPYFFNSLVFKRSLLLTFELTKVYRQRDPVFIDILNSIRDGVANTGLLEKLNQRYDPGLNENWRRDYVTLSTHNQLVNNINQLRLHELEGEPLTFKAAVQGEFPKEAYPAEEELVLKVGAQVMFIKNDSSGKKQYYNGRTGRITALSPTNITLEFLDDGTSFEVLQETWQNVKYSLSESEQKINESNNGSFSQYPLKLAWAITIHKSQGLTFEKAIIDVDAAFAFGQTYVALSRCRSLEGMVLKEPVRAENIRTDPQIISFMQYAGVHAPNIELLNKSVHDYDIEVLSDVFDFSIVASAWIKLNPADNSAAELKTIGDRFIKKEILTLDGDVPAWKNSDFLGRLKKAVSWFTPKLNMFSNNLNAFYAARATADVPDDFYENLNHLLVHLKAKMASFSRMAFATSSKDITSSAQEAALTFQPIFKNWNAKALPKEKEIVNPALYQQLLGLRKQISEDRSTPEYLLMTENALRDIAAKLPRSLDQLAQLKSFGEGKATDFGEQILKLVRNYLGENDLFW